MGLSTWRRFHGNLIANVISTEASGYTVAVWDDTSGTIEQLPRVFRALESAQAAADDLLRRTFKHTCSTGSCGIWLTWVA